MRPKGRCLIGRTGDNPSVEKDPKKLVGRRIRHFREEKGWSQEKLAEMADMDRTYVGRIERGEKNIGVENLFRLARTLGVAPGSLLSGE
jgi:transcriptional regulator with XRE-family HTH domain